MISRQLLNSANSVLTNKTKIYHLYRSVQQCQPQKLPIRTLHLTPLQLAKIYLDRENMHAHQVMESSLRSYQLFQVAPQPNGQTNNVQDLVKCLPENASTQQVFYHFKELCSYCSQTDTLISDSNFNAFVQQFCDHIHLLTDEQLRESLKFLSILPPEESVRSANFVDLWNILDIECCRRIESWQTDELLLLCDAWYNLNLTRVCDFVWEAMRKLGRKVSKMQPNQLVQTMFVCNVMRRTVFDMFDFEVNLAKCVKDISIAELGVMSMGFFKTKTPIRNPELLNCIYERLMDEMHEVDDITFVALLKVLRYSSKLPQVEIMTRLLDKINNEKFEQLNLLTSLHVALLGCELQCCHEEIIEKILAKFHKELNSTTRLKDLERISLVAALFNVRTPTKIEDLLCEKILDSLRNRIDEIMKYPRCFTNCLHFLSLRGYYDKEMLSTALERRFLKHAVGSNLAVAREIFHLDTFAKINLQNEQYDGAQLEDRYRKTMGKMLTHYIPERNTKYKLNSTDNILLQIKEITTEFLPNNKVKHILPNYERSDVVLCYDRLNRKSVAIADSCPEDYSGIILTRDLLLANENKDIDTVVIVIAGWNNVVRGKDRFTGLFDMKLKQLQLLGHKPVVIFWHEWRELETHQDRIKFVKRRLATVINL